MVLIDGEASRLQYAKAKLPGLETIDFKEKGTLAQLHELFKDDRGRYVGPDCAIEAVGFHYTK